MGTAATQPPVGTPPAGQSPADRGAGQPPAGTDAGGQGDRGNDQSGSGGAQAFDRSKLNPAIRDLPPDEINDLFQRLLNMSNSGGGNREPEPVKATPEPEPINFKELLDPNSDKYAPEQAFKQFVEQNYGQLLGDVNARSVRGLYGNFRTQIHDFNEYEQEIDQMLSKREPGSLTEKDVMGSYLTIKGWRALQKERQDRARQAGTTTTPPSPDKARETTEQLEPVAEEFAKQLFPNEADPVGKYREFKRKIDNKDVELRVPVDGAGKRG